MSKLFLEGYAQSSVPGELKTILKFRLRSNAFGNIFQPVISPDSGVLSQDHQRVFVSASLVVTKFRIAWNINESFVLNVDIFKSVEGSPVSETKVLPKVRKHLQKQ